MSCSVDTTAVTMRRMQLAAANEAAVKWFRAAIALNPSSPAAEYHCFCVYVTIPHASSPNGALKAAHSAAMTHHTASAMDTTTCSSTRSGMSMYVPSSPSTATMMTSRAVGMIAADVCAVMAGSSVVAHTPMKRHITCAATSPVTKTRVLQISAMICGHAVCVKGRGGKRRGRGKERKEDDIVSTRAYR